MVKIAASNIAN